MEEKGRDSVMDGIPAALPALAYAAKVQKKAESQGVPWRTLLVEPTTTTWPCASSSWSTRPAPTGADPETELRPPTQRLRQAFDNRSLPRAPWVGTAHAPRSSPAPRR